MRVSLIKLELPGYIFIQSVITASKKNKKKGSEASEKCLALLTSLKGGLFGT